MHRDYYRRTGRTHRVVLSALMHFSEGSTVVVVAPTQTRANQIADRAVHILRCDGVDGWMYTLPQNRISSHFNWGSIRFVGVDRVDNRQMCGLPVDTVFLYD